MSPLTPLRRWMIVPAPRNPTPVIIVDTTREVSAAPLKAITPTSVKMQAPSDTIANVRNPAGLVPCLPVEPDERPEDHRQHEAGEHLEL